MVVELTGVLYALDELLPRSVAITVVNIVTTVLCFYYIRGEMTNKHTWTTSNHLKTSRSKE